MLEILASLAEGYEEKNCPIDAPDPVEFLWNVMEFRGVDQAGLAAVLNSRPRASEILNRKRFLTLAQIRKIVEAWKVPADPLIRESET